MLGNPPTVYVMNSGGSSLKKLGARPSRGPVPPVESAGGRSRNFSKGPNEEFWEQKSPVGSRVWNPEAEAKCYITAGLRIL